MANQIHKLNWLQRGQKTHFNILSFLDGSNGHTLEELAQEKHLNIRDADLKNQAIIQGTVVLVQTLGAYNANLFESDFKTMFPALNAYTFDHNPTLGTTTTTTSTTSTTTTTTTTSTTTS